MNEKKAPQRFVPRPDGTMPDKAEADPRQTTEHAPRYKGAAKTEKPARPRRAKGRVKAAD